MVMQMIVNIFFFVSCLCIESVFRLTIYHRKDNFFYGKVPNPAKKLKQVWLYCALLCLSLSHPNTHIGNR